MPPPIATPTVKSIISVPASSPQVPHPASKLWTTRVWGVSRSLATAGTVFVLSPASCLHGLILLSHTYTSSAPSALHSDNGKHLLEISQPIQPLLPARSRPGIVHDDGAAGTGSCPCPQESRLQRPREDARRWRARGRWQRCPQQSRRSCTGKTTSPRISY